jgi:hypothetical protein
MTKIEIGKTYKFQCSYVGYEDLYECQVIGVCLIITGRKNYYQKGKDHYIHARVLEIIENYSEEALYHTQIILSDVETL